MGPKMPIMVLIMNIPIGYGPMKPIVARLIGELLGANLLTCLKRTLDSMWH